jgi:hypothetical protein
MISKSFLTAMGAPENKRSYSIVSEYTIEFQVYQVYTYTRYEQCIFLDILWF